MPTVRMSGVNQCQCHCSRPSDLTDKSTRTLNFWLHLTRSRDSLFHSFFFLVHHSCVISECVRFVLCCSVSVFFRGNVSFEFLRDGRRPQVSEPPAGLIDISWSYAEEELHSELGRSLPINFSEFLTPVPRSSMLPIIRLKKREFRGKTKICWFDRIGVWD